MMLLVAILQFYEIPLMMWTWANRYQFTIVQFRTEVWSLETEDGTVVQLLDSDTDPFRQE